ncbi:MAG: ferritin [Bacteroidales bacterium]|nr:ferritin [Bacteroidales bacterium]
MKRELYELFNKQINAEMYSAYLYLSMSAWCQSKNLKGSAHWLFKQYEEELSHAYKIMNFLYDRGERVILEKIETPPTDWDNLLDLFENVYEHEKHVTSLINKITDLAYELKDYASIPLLNWFVEEQVEEEASASEIVEKLKIIKDNKALLLYIDKELGKRE